MVVLVAKFTFSAGKHLQPAGNNSGFLLAGPNFAEKVEVTVFDWLSTISPEPSSRPPAKHVKNIACDSTLSARVKEVVDRPQSGT